MKYLIFLADGAADEPISELGGKTPLEAAHKPAIDRLAREGVTGLLQTVPPGYHPGSEIAHLGLLGYDVARVFEGRGSLEAASMQVPIEDGEVAMRCNLVCLDGDVIKNHSAGNISNDEAARLIAYLNDTLAHEFDARWQALGYPAEAIRFYEGVSYRHLLKVRGGCKQVHCTPPHDRIGQPWCPELPVAETPEAEATAQLLTEMIVRSQELLAAHPVNLERQRRGLDPANSIWPWSLGYRPAMQTMQQLFPDRVHTGAVISAVDLIFGIGVYAGLDKVEVAGATGLWDTNYEGKAEAALRALRDKDFVFVHVEATDEAGHDGDARLKTQCVESLDRRTVARVLAEVETWAEPVRIAILPDHPTPVRLRTHTMAPVPFAIWQSRPSRPGEPATIVPDGVQTFTEAAAREGAMGLLKDDQFIRAFLG